MSRFLHGSDEERNGMFKLIPHCAKGSWVVSQSVGTTPVILGRKLVSSMWGVWLVCSGRWWWERGREACVIADRGE